MLEGSSLSAPGAACGLCLWELWVTALLQGLPWGTTGEVLGWGEGQLQLLPSVPSQKSCAGGKRLGVDRRGGRAEALLGSWPLEEMLTPLCFAQSVCPLGRPTASFFDV